MGITKKSGFTIVELLIVVVVIGVLAAIVIVAYSGITSAAQEAKIASDLKNIKQAIFRLELDVGATVFGCPGNGSTYGPEGTSNAVNTGLVSVPTSGFINESCTWSAGAVASWDGPYMPNTLDPWDRGYRIDLDYFLCESGTAQLIAAAISMGENGATNYPTSATSGACTVAASDDVYLELWRP